MTVVCDQKYADAKRRKNRLAMKALKKAFAKAFGVRRAKELLTLCGIIQP